VDLRAPHRPGPALDAAHVALRARVPKLETDRVVSRDIETVRALIDDGSLVAAARRHIELE
ncbi:MAG: histidine ammonia-lyase, partial [Polyangia bacterium]